jgi:hypothetical protein
MHVMSAMRGHDQPPVARERRDAREVALPVGRCRGVAAEALLLLEPQRSTTVSVKVPRKAMIARRSVGVRWSESALSV